MISMLRSSTTFYLCTMPRVINCPSGRRRLLWRIVLPQSHCRCCHHQESQLKHHHHSCLYHCFHLGMIDVHATLWHMDDSL